MAANSSLELINLDFDVQKASLITFLRSQDRFKDYDFEGSNINVLLDVLTYNTFKNAFYTNMALCEGFLDSAQLRPSVLSHAKELNYFPRSARSAKATIKVEFFATGDHGPYIVQKGESFTCQVKNKSFIFSIPENIILASANTSFSFTTDVYEGPYLKESFIFDTTSGAPLRYKLTNQNIDTDSIVVNVFEDGNVLGNIYKRTLSLLDLNNFSKVYFIQTSAVDGNYELMFGDNIVGYQPKNGSLIVVDYRVTDGSAANGGGRFAINFDPTSPFSELISDMEITTLAAAMGGDEAETTETTRFYAPRWFQTQERAIVATDYVVLMKVEFPEIHAINVYGGEELTPPQFGKVIVALDIANVQGLPQSKLTQYYDFLKARCPLTVIPIFVSPIYTYIKIITTVKYNINVTSESIDRMKTIVLNAITDFNRTNLDDFDTTFRFSKFQRAIDDADPSIVSNLTNILLYKELSSISSTDSQTLNINFGLPLLNDLPPLPLTHKSDEEKVLSSSSFTFGGQQQCVLEDDGQGIVRIVAPEADSLNFVKNAGTIDYDLGIILLTDFKIDAFDGPTLCIYVRPRSNDVSCTLNTILGIKTDKVDIAIEQLRY
jgi:hypothetical protein